MKWHRIEALLIRHLYLYQRSVPRIMDILYWPVMALLLWGFLSVYLQKVSLAGVNILTVILGALIFWEVLDQAQRTVSVAFLEEVWYRNLLNIFVTPLRVGEFLVTTLILGFIRIALVSVVLSLLSFVFYKFDIFMFGFYLVPLVATLLLFGWILGMFVTAIILRLGASAQVLAFGFIFLIQPFSAVFYPVSALPQYLQYISLAIPSTYVFEGMRQVVANGVFPAKEFVWAISLNLVYLVLGIWFFHAMFARVKEKGLLLKLD